MFSNARATTLKFKGCLAFFIFTLICHLSACNNNNKETGAEVSPEPIFEQSETSMKLTGTIKYQNFEGGFYGFIDTKGNKYTISNLNEQYKQDGLKVSISAHAKENTLTTSQFGQLITVIEITVIDAADTQSTSSDL